MSDRALILGRSLAAFDLDTCLDPLEDQKIEGKMLASELVPDSDKLMYTVQGPKFMHLMFDRDPSRRNCNIIGHQGMRDCISANIIGKDLILMQIRARRGGTSWVYASSLGSGSIKRLPKKM